jgi:amidophosphoribosyltransferase
MGVDMGTHKELIANKFTLAEIQARTGAASLYFISLEGMMAAIGRSEGYCNACFTGVYPFEVNFGQTKTGFENTMA